MSSVTWLPVDWVPLREAAEAAARELYGALPVGSPQNAYRVEKSGWIGREYTQTMPWDEQTAEWRARLTDAHAHLLADLTRPASRDFWARWWYEHTPWRIPNIERRRIADGYRDDAAALRLALLSVRP